jgi:hypothetical protein
VPATHPIESQAGIITKTEWQLQAVMAAYNTLHGFLFAAVSLVLGFYLTVVIGLFGFVVSLLPVLFFAGPYIGACLWVAGALWRRKPWAIVAFAVICLLNVPHSFF